MLLDKHIWKSKAPQRSNLLSGLMLLTGLTVNTNDVLQKQRPLTALSPNMYVMCCSSQKNGSHLFLHHSAANSLWNRLVGIFGENQVCPKNLRRFILIKLRGFGFLKMLELFSSVLFCCPSVLMVGKECHVSLIDMQRHWHALLHDAMSQLLCIFFLFFLVGYAQCLGSIFFGACWLFLYLYLCSFFGWMISCPP